MIAIVQCRAHILTIDLSKVASAAHRYSDRACPRSITADSRPHDRPSVYPTCPRYEYLGHATEKYSSDPCFRCNPRSRYRPVCRRPRCYTQRKYTKIKISHYNNFVFTFCVNDKTFLKAIKIYLGKNMN
ncbi:hypothetical protein PUN28_009626 [Cardiocondyla obscurior]|uniref:Uncharacterized protein n=1 Tax=Cardiocondyla obscurior TaxID=286306 RepID=A0AAW2FUM9_9HYME